MDLEIIGVYGDIIAIVGFALLIYYMYKKKTRSLVENVLYLFGIGGFVVDFILTLYRFT